MTRYRCNNCGGEYDDILPDGMTYFHACPPLPEDAPEAKRRAYRMRDENIVEDIETGEVRVKSEGKGRTKIRG